MLKFFGCLFIVVPLVTVGALAIPTGVLAPFGVAMVLAGLYLGYLLLKDPEPRT